MKSWSKYFVIYVCFNIILCCGYYLKNYKNFNDLQSTQYTYTVEDLLLKNCELKDGVLYSLSDDPQAIIEYEKEEYIYDVKIIFKEKNTEDVPINIYYTSGEEYSKDDMISAVAFKNTKYGNFHVNERAKKIRLDIDGLNNGLKISSIEINHDYVEYVKARLEAFLIKGLVISLIISTAMLGILLLGCFGYKAVIKLLLKYRWIIGLGIIIFCTLFKISGSSISRFNEYINDDKTSIDTIIGSSKEIRTDEWAVFTPMALSQEYNNYQQISSIVRGIDTDTYIVYGQPVLSWKIIFRPFQIGYLLFGSERGLAFYWSARFIILFLITYEFGLLICENKKFLSLFLALFTTLAPLIQWWFSINELVEMIIFAEGSIILLDRYMNTKNTKCKILYMSGIDICAGGFILAFYPAWEVPLAYIVLIFIIWILKKNWQQFKKSYRDLLIIGLGLTLLAGSMGIILYQSWDAINATLNTAYPGKREVFGGNLSLLSRLFRYPGNIFHGMFLEITNSNVCEHASFYSLFPLGLLLTIKYFVVQIKNKRKVDLLLILLMLGNIFLTLYCLFNLPPIIAKSTLLNYATPPRVIQIVSFINLLLLVRVLAVYKPKLTPQHIIICLIMCIGNMYICKMEYGDYLSNIKCLISGGILFCVTISVLYRDRKIFDYIAIWSVSLVGIIAGLIVNPIQYGLDSIYQNSLMRQIKLINDEEPGIWVVDNQTWMMGAVPIMVGASTITSTHVYPTLEMWSELDKNGECEDIYNRYAHYFLNLQNQTDSTFESVAAAGVRVRLNINDLKKLNVEYIMTNRCLENIDIADAGYDMLYNENGYYIYKCKE